MKIFSVIVNFNCGDQIVDTLNGLLKNGVRVIVVDNASTDGSVEMISRRFDSKVKILRNKKNAGFARAVNQAIRQALSEGADKIFLINPDTSVSSSLIEELSYHQEDIVSPVIKFKLGGTTKYDHGGKVKWLFGRTYHLETDSPQRVNVNIDYVSGCAMLIDKEVFKKIGYFNEKYFLYFEDVDFCLRAKKAGLKIKVIDESVITHRLIPGKEKSRRQQLIHLRSNLFFINEYYPLSRRLIPYLYLGFVLVKIYTR